MLRSVLLLEVPTPSLYVLHWFTTEQARQAAMSAAGQDMGHVCGELASCEVEASRR